ncbi:MAG TPA: CheR family methyltransferase [Vicinamibacterales bacterium]|nr:CheR family methyltransferase [Vicinamibacterales bacterium]
MPAAVEPNAFRGILEHLRQTRGFDFTAYKPTSLMRRVRRRMQVVDIDEFDQYLDYLQSHPEEFAALFNTILINVTAFFRDPDVWTGLRENVLPELAANRSETNPIRVWSAGCAAGQEAYTVAMVLAELIGLDAFRDRVKIYATDVDDEALAEGRRAVYTAKQVADVPPELLERYFTRNSSGEVYTVDRDLRRSVIFGRLDLIQDAPISRVDLILCRNTLMYFNAEAQARIMSRFSFALKPEGHLVLGRAEMLFSHSSAFAPVDLKRRVFKTAPKGNPRDRLHLLAHAGREDIVAKYPDSMRLRDAAFEVGSDPQFVLSPDAVVVSLNAAARRQFGLTDAAVGASLQDLEISYRPADLRSAIDRVRLERREIVLRGQPWDTGGAIRFLDVTVAPLLTPNGAIIGLRVDYHDVTPIRTLQEELTQSKHELETAYEELQSTNEELETTNEELQSTVEELETTNEELQSTNEELETMNEELQSTNEELQTMNDELRHRSAELNVSNAFLEAVFTSLRAAVVVVDRDLRVQVWNAGALDLWGVRADEAQGTSFFNLDVGLPVGELHQPMREILSGSAAHREVVLSATNRKGRSIRCRVSIAPLRAVDRAVTGAILVMEEEQTSPETV